MHQQVVGLLGPIPAAVSVHGVVASHQGGDSPAAAGEPDDVARQRAHDAVGGGGQGVAAVEKAVDRDGLDPQAYPEVQAGE